VAGGGRAGGRTLDRLTLEIDPLERLFQYCQWVSVESCYVSLRGGSRTRTAIGGPGDRAPGCDLGRAGSRRRRHHAGSGRGPDRSDRATRELRAATAALQAAESVRFAQSQSLNNSPLTCIRMGQPGSENARMERHPHRLRLPRRAAHYPHHHTHRPPLPQPRPPIRHDGQDD
jgi:hypothetical protein